MKGIISSKTLISANILNTPYYLGTSELIYRRKIPTAVNTKLDILVDTKVVGIKLVKPVQDIL
jgi:hypothetical protein